jgi:adenosylcobinamide-phosphate synthase
VPAALAYKAVNTLDSMIGHRNPPYTYFGRVAARLDDVANFIPARLSAVAIAVAAAFTGGHAVGAFRIWWRDGARHESPNAGHPEAAMAGALGVCLGGTNYYDGVPVPKPELGAEGHVPTTESAQQACRIVAVASFASVVLAVLAVVAVLVVRRWRP